MPISMHTYGISRAKQDRVLFAAACLAEVIPGPKEKRIPKGRLFKLAALYGKRLEDCPDYWVSAEALRIWMRNHWKEIRRALPHEHKIMPTYVNGAEFEGGGGYRKGTAAMVQQQVEHNKKITEGVVRAHNDSSEDAVLVFPKTETETHALVPRQITRRRR